MFEYKFYTDKYGRKVVLCLTKYNGKTIRGKAICHPEDKYDEYRGKQLAYLRCETEYLCRRVKDVYAFRKSLEWQIKELQDKYNRANNLLIETGTKYANLEQDLVIMEKEVSKENSEENSEE